MRYIGCHISSSGGFVAMAKEAERLCANTFAYFTRNPRGGSVKPQDEADVAKFLQMCADMNMGKVVAHAPYTYNAAAEKPNLRVFAKEAMTEDLQRMQSMPGNYYNFHPGSHVGQGAQKGIELIVDLLNDVLTEDLNTTVLLETMAGKGSEVGRTFEELRQILDGVKLPHKMGVLLDTCHVWDAGYDIVNNLDGVLKEFDDVIGLENLRAIHCNDSQNELGAHKDRHAKIGEGKIGTEAFARIVNHQSLQNLPLVLETPNDFDGWKGEIELLRRL